VQERLIRDGKVRRGLLGTDIVDLDLKSMKASGLADLPALEGAETIEEIARRLGLAEPAGAVVYSVRPFSPAASIPLRRLDVIVEFDGRPIRSIHELVLRVVEMEPGRKVKVKFVRDRKAQEGFATLDERVSPASSARPPDLGPSPHKTPRQ